MSSRPDPARRPRAGLGTVLKEWGRIGCLGFGGPPAHIALLRKTLRRGPRDGSTRRSSRTRSPPATCCPDPPPPSWRSSARGGSAAGAGALVGGVAFIVPGLIVILALAALFLRGDPPHLGARPPARAPGPPWPPSPCKPGSSLIPAGWRRAPQHSSRRRWVGVPRSPAPIAAATIGPWLVLLLIACGVVEVLAQRVPPRPAAARRPGCRCSPRPGPAAACCSRSPGSPSRSARCPTAADSSSSRSCGPTPSTTTTG